MVHAHLGGSRNNKQNLEINNERTLNVLTTKVLKKSSDAWV